MTRDDKLHEAERAVIEAAEETVRDSYRPELLYDAERFDRLKAAVEALQATREPVPLDKVKTWEGES